MFSLEQQLRDEPRKKTGQHLAKIADDVRNRKKYIAAPSIAKRFIGVVEHDIFPLLGQTVKRYCVDRNKCIKCGICGKVCPMDNITYNPWPVYGDNCIMSGSCRQNCPKKCHTL